MIRKKISNTFITHNCKIYSECAHHTKSNKTRIKDLFSAGWGIEYTKYGVS